MKKKLMAMMAKMMMACDEATFLLSKEMDGEISWKEKMSLKMHLMSCYICRLYAKDMMALTDYLRHTHSHSEHKLNHEQKERIHEKLVMESKN